MAVTHWLIDKSAFARLSMSTESEAWATRVARGLVAVSTVTRLEVGYSARTATDLHRLLDHAPLRSMPVEYLTPAIEDRAVDVQRMLAERGQHRAPSIPDLLIAATAELTRRTVLHVDHDFDVIASVTGQTMERLDL
jgi:predicted nucleic acid-binding protein